MITKIISGLLGMSIVLSSSSVLARNILMGVTKDGAKLYALTNYPPNSEDDGMEGWTSFIYAIEDAKGYREVKAYTSFCNGGKLLSQPVKGTKDTLKVPGWHSETPSGPVRVIADSKASLDLLKSVCYLAYNQYR
ncbi:MAG: hypothetical protein RM049_25870 [Nostoc sp. DedQUE04]|uniref:hypothetical protein n=1 Tax=Nostoc sp. DedQUE04 TaxID=3075390 RepID=UPI002AD28269|nr:hypothetical protein [Nostoc sp. DedQUE04]MDZ8138691.1 hypothetical protein [Nostoc sp. DedQUE04]